MASPNRETVVAALLLSVVLLGLAQESYPLHGGSVAMSTDKPCYRPGEPVQVTATGNGTVNSVGDFPRFFWAVTNTSGSPVWETQNPFDAIGWINGTLEGTWNQTSRLFSDPVWPSRPVYGGPVPPADYTIWFYEVPVPPSYPATWTPAHIAIGDCAGSFAVDAGGPYVGTEGTPITLEATANGTAAEVSARWDFEGDGIWDTSFSPSLSVEHAWGDDFEGKVCVEARGVAAEVPIYRVTTIPPYEAFSGVSRGTFIAQSFVANSSRLIRLRVNVAINYETPELPLVVSLNETLNGTALATWEINPGDLPVRELHWVEFPANLSLVIGERYFVVFQTEEHPGAYEVHHSSDQYATGWVFTRGGFESEWTELKELDTMMELWGTGDVSAADCASVNITNVSPRVTNVGIIRKGGVADLGLRVAGRKWNVVNLTLSRDGVPVASAGARREPRSPDEQIAWIAAPFDLSSNYTATVTYEPADLGGKEVGANPVWLVARDLWGNVTFLDHHAFNVERSEEGNSSHWNHVEPWLLDLAGQLPSAGAVVSVSAEDPASDDLMFLWSTGETRTYFNDGVGPDPWPSPSGTFPFFARDSITIPYASHASISVEIQDDDGGSVVVSIVLP